MSCPKFGLFQPIVKFDYVTVASINYLYYLSIIEVFHVKLINNPGVGFIR